MASASPRKRMECDGIGVGAGQDHLEGTGAVEPDLPGVVDDPHRSPAEFPQDLVAGDGRDARFELPGPASLPRSVASVSTRPGGASPVSLATQKSRLG